MDVQLRQMKRYLQPRIFSRELMFLIAGVVCIVVAGSLFVRSLKIYLATGVYYYINGTKEVLIFLIFCVFLCSAEGIYKSIKFRKHLHDLKQTGEMSNVLSDFEYATPMFGGRVMMGRKYAFGKKCGTAIAYADIERVYEYVHSTNSIKDVRMIKVKMITGKKCDLCYLKVFKEEPEEEMAIIKTILERNPSVQVGVE